MCTIARAWLSFLAITQITCATLAQIPTTIPWHAGTFEDAAAEAREKRRLLVVFMRGPDRAGEDAFDKVESHTLMNRSLHQWIQWHAVLTQVRYEEDPGLFDALESRIGTPAGPAKNVSGQFDMRRDPYFIVFRDGKYEEVFPRPYLLMNIVLTPRDRRSTVPDKYDQDMRDPLRGRYHWIRGIQGLSPPIEPLSDGAYIKPMELLLQLDLYLDRLRAKEPVWVGHHDRLNPPPAAPNQVLFSKMSDPDGDAWPPADSDPGLWSSLVQAREEARTGNQRLATGIYTWLWESGTRSAHWLAPLRRTIVASEMRDLGMTRAGSRSRFERMHTHTGERYAWADFVERWDWIILGEINDNVFDLVTELDYSLNDPDEGSVATTTEQAGLRLLSQRSPWSEVWTVSSDDIKRLDAIRALERQRRAPRATEEEWAELVALRRAVLLSEACRIHIASLRNRSDTQAMRIAADLIKSDTDGTARLALASMAWAAGLADERHVAWVKEAVALGADDRGLHDAMSPATSARPSATSD